MNVTTDAAADGAKQLLFGWLDFTLFILTLVLSTLIGIYFGSWVKTENTPKEYLHGGKTMSTIPVAVSLVARLVQLQMVTLEAMGLFSIEFLKKSLQC
jgi:hypothetical protein